MHFDYCRDCEREALCQYPCSEFTTESGKFNNINDNVINEKQSNQEETEENESSNSNETENLLALSCDCDCIENFLQYDVTDSEFLDVLNDDMDIMNMIDMSALLSYMSKINETYCEANNLCTQCHSKLIEIEESRGECFGTPVSEEIIVCPKCG